ncbi:MAG TPA: hypothetical protein VL651_07815, partial [Bacteroidia bacterium]|nr:hypothetical protein [Bacteroidia bacterium]
MKKTLSLTFILIAFSCKAAYFNGARMQFSCLGVMNYQVSVTATSEGIPTIADSVFIDFGDNTSAWMGVPVSTTAVGA